MGAIYTRDQLETTMFSGWDKRRAFIFDEVRLVGIVYNSADNPGAPERFCVYGAAGGTYQTIFGNSPSSLLVIPVFKSEGNNNVEFVGCFEVVYIGGNRKSNCPKTGTKGILVGEIELKPII